MTQSPVVKTVFYVNIFGLDIFREVLNKRPDLRFVGLRDDSPEAEASAVLASASVYHISSSARDMVPQYYLNEQLLARAPCLLLASAMGAGYDPVDVAACTRAGVLVVNQAGGANAEAVAEHMLAMMLALSKRMVEADRNMRRTANVVRAHYLGRNALGKTVGIIGYGHVGRRLAEMCKAALRMRVLVHSSQDLGAAGVEQVSLEQLLRESDYVNVCCALSERTRGLMGAREFALMAAHAVFVTAARGGIHDEQALTEALLTRRIAGAGVDVWDVEPPPLDHPLLQLDNVICTPHTGGATIESRIQASEDAARQVLAVLDGQRPPRLLNPEAWPLFAKRFEAQFGFAPSGAPAA